MSPGLKAGGFRSSVIVWFSFAGTCSPGWASEKLPYLIVHDTVKRGRQPSARSPPNPHQRETQGWRSQRDRTVMSGQVAPGVHAEQEDIAAQVLVEQVSVRRCGRCG